MDFSDVLRDTDPLFGLNRDEVTKLVDDNIATVRVLLNADVRITQAMESTFPLFREVIEVLPIIHEGADAGGILAEGESAPQMNPYYVASVIMKKLKSEAYGGLLERAVGEITPNELTDAIIRGPQDKDVLDDLLGQMNGATDNDKRAVALFILAYMYYRESYMINGIDSLSRVAAHGGAVEGSTSDEDVGGGGFEDLTETTAAVTDDTIMNGMRLGDAKFLGLMAFVRDLARRLLAYEADACVKTTVAALIPLHVTLLRSRKEKLIKEYTEVMRAAVAVVPGSLQDELDKLRETFNRVFHLPLSYNLLTHQWDKREQMTLVSDLEKLYI
jgi:hypothetical protein